jgi:S1-C subfamily serine protease
MSDRDNWPSEQGATGRWTPPSPGSGAVGDTVPEPAPGPAAPTGPNAPAQGPAWPPASSPLSGPGQPGNYGPQHSPGQGYIGQGHPGQNYGDTSQGGQGYGGPGPGRPRSDTSYGAPSYGAPSYGGPSYGGPSYGGPSYGGQPYGPPPQPGAYPYDHFGPTGQGRQPDAGPYNFPPYAQPYGGQPPYRPPAYGADQSPYGEKPSTGPGRLPGRSRGLRSAAAVLVIAAAAVVGAGASRVIWPASQAASAAAPAVTTPTTVGNGGSGGSGLPFGDGTGAGGTSTGGNASPEGAGGPSDVSAIAAKVDPALVDVNVTFNYQYAEGAGTGIVLSSNGLVLTNNHVIDEATKISVTDVGNGQTYTATVLGYDNRHDVALLQLQGASGLATAKLASTSASVGQAVVAIGNAGGSGGTPTSAGGSVTALDQSITASDELTQRNEQLSGLIEVNANVESGDSGGPLVNASGQVVGMDTAASESFAFATQGNQGFAIPISYAMGIAKQIESGKSSSPVHVGPTAFLGVLLSPAGETSPAGTGSPFGGDGTQTNSDGLEVANVIAGTPAQKAGIAEGDTITSFNGTKVSSGEDLTDLLVDYHPGQKVTIGWVTSLGQSQMATLVLSSGPPS